MSLKVNGEHKEKILQRWEGGDGTSDDYDLDSDMVRRKKNGAKSTPPPIFFFCTHLHHFPLFSPQFRSRTGGTRTKCLNSTRKITA